MAKPAPADPDSRVRMTHDGLIPVPADIRQKWNLKPGDELSFDAPEPDVVRLRPITRRSVFERLDECGRPLTQEDIEAAITEAVTEKERRSWVDMTIGIETNILLRLGDNEFDA